MTDDAPTMDPSRSALLVMDYQNGIVGSLDGGDHLLERVADAIALARQGGVLVCYVRVGFNDGDLAAMPAASAMAAAAAQGGAAMHADSAHTAVHDTIAPQSGDLVVRKTRVGAFSTTDLDEQLRTRGIDTLLLAGIATSGVVLSTVRDAADRDYRVLVVGDASADRDPEVHDFLLSKIFPRQATIVSVAQLAALFAPRGPA